VSSFFHIARLSFSTAGKDFDGHLRIWPALSSSRFLLFQRDVTVQGDAQGLEQEQIDDLLQKIVPINKEVSDS